MIPIFPRSVTDFEDAYIATFCPTCGAVLSWLGGYTMKDSGSEQPVLIWFAEHCGQHYTLRRIQQRPSDHTLWHGYVDFVKPGELQV